MYSDSNNSYLNVAYVVSKMSPSSTGTSLPSGDSGIQALLSCGLNIFNMELPGGYVCLHQTGRRRRNPENCSGSLVNQAGHTADHFYSSAVTQTLGHLSIGEG